MDMYQKIDEDYYYYYLSTDYAKFKVSDDDLSILELLQTYNDACFHLGRRIAHDLMKTVIIECTSY